MVVTGFKSGKPVRSRWYETDSRSLDRAARTIEKAAETLDVYLGVATHREKPDKGRGSSRTACSLPGFWADIDIGTDGHKPASLPNPSTVEEALSIIEGLPEPSAVIHSGGGLQVWWKFAERWTFDDGKEAAAASRAWQEMIAQRGEEKGFHVDVVADLPRILRAPGTTNRKLVLEGEPSGPVRPVTLLRPPSTATYPAAELTALGADSEEVDSGHVSGSADTDNRAHGDADHPLGTWADILAPHGWTQVGTRAEDGAEIWCRPGKKASEGTSAVTNPYGKPVMVNFSGSCGLPVGPGQRLTKFRVWAHLNYDGDMKAAQAAYSRVKRDSPEKLAEIAARFAASLIDWPALWTDEIPEPAWIVEPLIERGRQAAFYAGGKTGKTLLWWELVGAVCTGRAVLGNPVRDPVKVLYIDRENTPVDLREKLMKMGYGPGDDFGGNLYYYSFPTLGWLDTEAGARDLYALAKVHDVELVILDTLSRVVEGAENDADTFLNFYKYTGVRLKADGIAMVRIDHDGKDKSRGMRGSIAKTTDVDDVWRLDADDDDEDLLTLTRTMTRAKHGASELTLRRLDNPLRHEIETGDAGLLTPAEDTPMWEGLETESEQDRAEPVRRG